MKMPHQCCFTGKKYEVLCVGVIFAIIDAIFLSVLQWQSLEVTPFYCVIIGHRVSSILSSVILILATAYESRFLMLPFLIIQGFTFLLFFILCMLGIGFLGLVGIVAIDENPEAMNFEKSIISAMKAETRHEALAWTSIFLASSIIFLTFTSFAYGIVLEYYQSFNKPKAVQRHTQLNDTILTNYTIRFEY